MIGRRLPDTLFGLLPDSIQPGDYWKYLSCQNPTESMDCGDEHHATGNLTRTVWGYMPPSGDGVGTLRMHTVREQDDGTISVRSGDGSSNSILHTRGDKTWHGYIEHGAWSEC